MHDAVGRLTRLVRDLRTLTHGHETGFAEARSTEDIGMILREAADVVAPDFAAAGLELSVATGGQVPLWCNRARKRLVFDNLPGNALRYTDAPGRAEASRSPAHGGFGLGLEIGADDYLCKPFSPRELVARIKAVLRRTMPPAEPDAPALVMDPESWRATLMGQPLELTRREFQVLDVLHWRPGRVLSRAQLLEQAFPEDADVIDRTIDTHIKNIRSKVKRLDPEMDLIRSVYGVG